MKFRTTISIDKYPFQIDYKSRIFGLGSCFVDNIKDKFNYYQFQNRINDFGTIFNPVSIANMLQRVENQHFFNDDDIFYHHDTWKSFDLHSQFNRSEKNQLLDEINQKLQENFDFLQHTDVAVFTLGTAWVYRHKKSRKIVSNCHKVAQSEFDKVLLTPTEIVTSLNQIIKTIQTVGKDTRVLFTVSPVRHLRDGFTENQQSKAHLLTAVHQVIDNQRVLYFPSYEIMMDDLRDYRFYKDDFLHPNNLAIDYIWQLVTESIIHPGAYSIMNNVAKIRKAMAHKAFDKQSEAHQKHLQKMNKQIQILQKSFPWMKF